MQRRDFPLLKKYVYFDSAGSVLKPRIVSKAMQLVLTNNPINPHTFDSPLGIEINQMIESVRQQVAELVQAKAENVIFTSGTTDGLNKLALMLDDFLKPGDEILLSFLNHASNIIPWLEMARRRGAKVVYAQNLLSAITPQTRLIALAQVNNTLNAHLNLDELFQVAKANQILVINDAAQAIFCANVTLQNADALVFSSNKLFGPTGCGALVISDALFAKIRPVTYGSNANETIMFDQWTPKSGNAQFEPGTPNTIGIVGMGVGITYFLQNKAQIFRQTKIIAHYAFEQLSTIKNSKIYSSKGDNIMLFNIGNFHAQDVVSYLGHKGFILRAGEHCAKMSNHILTFVSTIRLSIGPYNTKRDIDQLVTAINQGGNFLDFI